MEKQCEVLIGISRSMSPVILATQDATVLHECELGETHIDAERR